MNRRHFITRLSIQLTLGATLTVWASAAADAKPPQPVWKPVQIDTIEIGYGLQLTDVNGDGKTDIVLADKKTVQWYESPKWTKHVIARNLTERDNVCVTARDLDGDGKCEIAVGGQWNYRESRKDGAVFYLHPPADRTKMWRPIQLYNEPSVHRMHWIKTRDGHQLMVKPLRGRGSDNGDGPGLKILAYTMPEDPTGDWKHTIVCDFLHLSHNFHVVNWDKDPEEEMIVAAKEGVWHFDSRPDGTWKPTQLTKAFAGEIRDGRLPNGKRFIVTVEPKHGSTCAVYVEPEEEGELWSPLKVLDTELKDGHALAVADYLQTGSDQVVVGWRAMNDPGVPGIKFFAPLDPAGARWRGEQISADRVAVEDVKAADLNGDGRVDVVAAARQTKNLVIFFNGRP